MGLYLTLESFQKLHAPFKFYIRFCFIFSIILGCLILYNISVSQTDMNCWLKILVRIFLVLGIVLKSYAEYSCLKHNMKKFTDKEFRTLKIFILIKFIFRSVLTVFFFIIFIGYTMVEVEYQKLFAKEVEDLKQIALLDEEILRSEKAIVERWGKFSGHSGEYTKYNKKK